MKHFIVFGFVLGVFASGTNSHLMIRRNWADESSSDEEIADHSKRETTTPKPRYFGSPVGPSSGRKVSWVPLSDWTRIRYEVRTPENSSPERRSPICRNCWDKKLVIPPHLLDPVNSVP